MLLRTKMALAAAALAGTLAAVPAMAAPASGGPTDVDFGVTIGPTPGPYYGYDEEYTGPTFGGPYAYSEPDYGYDRSPAIDRGPAFTYNDAESWCASHFRSYNPATHTYFGYDGAYHSCP